MNLKNSLVTIALACAATAPIQAALVVNGGFESGLSGWTVVNQTGSDGAFLLQSGVSTPTLGETVPAPPEGLNAAMTDAEGSGSHILYQDFLVPTGIANAILQFSIYIRNAAGDFVVPDTLDFATPALNQQVRVDLLRPSADPFSVETADILLNLYQTQAGVSAPSGYTTISRDISSLLQANVGQTLRLRFAEVDNVFTLNAGVDAVDVVTSAVPEPATWLLVSGALLGLAQWGRSSARA
jgi:hypothetical protein